MNAFQLELPNLIQIIVIGAVVLLGLVALMIVLRILFFRPKKQQAPEKSLKIDLASLAVSGPPKAHSKLEFYGTPVRFVALVLAPAGRVSAIPPVDQIPDLLNIVIPGLGDILIGHKPLVRFWPPQLSSQGFTQSFFTNLQVPGDRGRGTPWCSVAGKFGEGNQQYLVGLVCYAEKPNSMTPVIVQHEGMWLDVLRVKNTKA